MKNCMILFILLVVVILFILIGFSYKSHPESFSNNECPTTLVKDGNKFLLYNPSLAKIPGVNPIQMDSLDDYEKYIQWQRKNKVQCPILHLDKVFDQHSEMYSIKSSLDTGTGSCTGTVMNHNLPIMNEYGPASFYEKENLGQIQNNYTTDYYATNLLNQIPKEEVSNIPINGYSSFPSPVFYNSTLTQGLTQPGTTQTNGTNPSSPSAVSSGSSLTPQALTDGIGGIATATSAAAAVAASAAASVAGTAGAAEPGTAGTEAGTAEEECFE